MPSTRLILLRHAETQANASLEAVKVWQGATDTPLTARGELQVAATAAHIATLHRRHAIDGLYGSTLPRARRTAEAINKAISVPLQIDHDLREFDLGEWEGRTFAELEEVENLSQRWQIDPHFAPPGGESPYAFQQRLTTTFTRLAALHHGHTLLVVTHAAVIRNLLALWIGDGPEDWHRWGASNCSLTILEKRGQAWHPVVLNDTSHLPPQAIKAKEQSHDHLNQTAG